MLLQGRGKNDAIGCVRAIWWWDGEANVIEASESMFKRTNIDGGLFVRLVVCTMRARSKFVMRLVSTSLALTQSTRFLNEYKTSAKCL